jgi:hypothetical protein
MECHTCAQVLRTWWVGPSEEYPGIYGHKVEFSSSSGLASGSFLLSIYVCKNKLEWILHLEPEVDVTPVLSTFKELLFNPYVSSSELLPLLNEVQQLKISANTVSSPPVANFLETISARLLVSIQQAQDKKFKEFVSSYPNAEFEADILRGNTESMTSMWRSDRDFVGVEFPLLSAVRNMNIGAAKPFLNYLESNTFREPLIFTRILYLPSKGDRSTSKVEDRLSIPATSFPCSANVDISGIFINGKHKSAVIPADNVPVCDKCVDAVLQLSAKWSLRKQFIEECSRIAAVLEFDALDFSYVIAAVRLRRGQLCTVCTVDFRLTAGFPAAMPLISVYDLQTSTSTVLDANNVSGTRDSNCCAEKLAEEYLSLAAKFIAKQAFGE